METFLAKVQGQQGYQDTRIRELVSANQIHHIRNALEFTGLNTVIIPEKLERLVDVGLLGARDLNFPWEEPFYYQASATSIDS